MAEMHRGPYYEHRWIRLDGSDKDRVVAKCEYCDIGAYGGGCVFTPKQWNALVAEGRTVPQPIPQNT